MEFVKIMLVSGFISTAVVAYGCYVIEKKLWK